MLCNVERDLACAAKPAIALADILGAFSYALDLTDGQPEGHSVRVCWIGVRLGQALGLNPFEIRDLYYTLLLKDLGCSSNAARICELYLTDDRTFKHDYKLVDGGIATSLAFLLKHTGVNSPVRGRAGALINVLRNNVALARELTETRCTRGADIARRLRFSNEVAAGIFSLDEHWDGSGKPHGLHGDTIPLYSRIALLAQVADVFNTNAGPAAALTEVRRRSGAWFDPGLVPAFERLATAETFWAELSSPLLSERLLALEPAQATIFVDEVFLDEIAAAFGDVVDAKSPYTAGHSSRVADYVDAVADRLDYNPARRRWLRRGALLHDIGKLGVSNAVLDKPGPLDAGEWQLMREHAALTEAILTRVTPFRDIAPLAAAHHERLDGQGYPKRLRGDEIAVETRIISVCDFFDALTAPRPYRAAMDVDVALDLMRGHVGTAIDRHCFQALCAVVEAADLGTASSAA